MVKFQFSLPHEHRLSIPPSASQNKVPGLVVNKTHTCLCLHGDGWGASAGLK